MQEKKNRMQAWQRELRLQIGWALAAKFLGLVLLWLLFFRK
jgi:hypothetical protein